jgi:catechol 2,3-dioxygenase-like lactoylglutathione lyase family enzyme
MPAVRRGNKIQLLTAAFAVLNRCDQRSSCRRQFRGEYYSFSLVRDERPLTEHVHLAFAADTDTTVRAFQAAALAAGYEDHGIPGERAIYHPGYYGAFVLDPDGHNVEVVNHNG